MPQSEKQKSGTKLRLDPDIEEAVWVKAVKVKTPLNRIVNAMLRAWIEDGSANPPLLATTNPPADAAKLRRAAATARQLAEQLDTLSGGNAEPSQDTISMPIQALISMLMEVMKNGQNAPAAEAVQAAVDRIAREFGTADRTATADSGSAASTARGKRGSAR